MKFTLLILSLAFTLSSFAQTSTFIEVTPLRPVNCHRKIHNHPFVNWVYEVQKVSETADEVSFRFLTEYGACKEGKKEPFDVSQEVARVSVMKRGLFSTSKGISVSTEQFSNSELEVTMTFQKSEIFKKSNERVLWMAYMPGMVSPYSYIVRNSAGQMQVVQTLMRFDWNLDLTLESVRSSTTLRIQ